MELMSACFKARSGLCWEAPAHHGKQLPSDKIQGLTKAPGTAQGRDESASCRPEIFQVLIRARLLLEFEKIVELEVRPMCNGREVLKIKSHNILDTNVELSNMK